MVFGNSQALKVTLYSDPDCSKPVPTTTFKNGICNGKGGKLSCLGDNQALFTMYTDSSCQSGKIANIQLIADGKSCNVMSGSQKTSMIVDCINLSDEANSISMNGIGTGQQGNAKSNTIMFPIISIFLFHILFVNIFL